MIDSHCHLQYADPGERERQLDSAREAGVSGFLVPAVRFSDAEALLAMAGKHHDVWCALGVHPHEAASWSDVDESRFIELLREPRVVAVGECGLDFYYDHAPRDVQLVAMRRQWEIARDEGLPVIVHNRDSNEEMLAEALRPEHAGLTGVFHSFAGGLEMAERLWARDFYFGLSGMVTFPKADNVREVLPRLSRECLLVETDSPYLAPVPHRGKANEPAFVVEIARRVASEWGLTLEEVGRLTDENFFRLFPKAERAE